LLISLLFSFCQDSKQNFFIKSVESVGEKDYFFLLEKAKDSLDFWVQNKLPYCEAETLYDYHVDSLICFNREKNRFVGSIHLFGTQHGSVADNLIFFYGERLTDSWFFFKGANVVIPREMVSGHDIHTPLSYQQLHEIALKEVYANYLTPEGEVNENWFKQHFEGDGYGKYRDKAHLDSIKIASCKMIWVDEKKIFEKEEIQVITDEKKGVNIIRFPLKEIDKEGYVYPIGVTLQRFTAGVTYQYIDKKEHYWNYIRDYTPVNRSQINSIIEIRDSISYKGDKERRDNCYRVTILLGLDKGYLTSDSVWARAGSKIIP
jgi:hypothetical protein